jgi:hypothetical protein
MRSSPPTNVDFQFALGDVSSASMSQLARANAQRAFSHLTWVLEENPVVASEAGSSAVLIASSLLLFV